MNDTPETDAFFLKRGSWSDDILACCRKLERERDEAQYKLEDARQSLEVALDDLLEAKRERDEARELAQQMSESNQVLMADVRFYRNAWEQRRDTTQ